MITDVSPQSLAVAELRGITKHYKGRGPNAATISAVESVDLQVKAGRTLGLVGESGSGKSTVARLLLRLVPPTSGTVILKGIDITRARGAGLRALRVHMQMVFQDPYSSFDPLSSIADSIAEALRASHASNRSERGGNKSERNERVAELLEQVGLARVLMSRRPRELSGGQLQRAAIARALAVGPELIALDEAVSSLDGTTRAQIINLLESLQQETGVAYLFISHDLSVVRHVSHDIAVMYLGKVVETGPAAAVYRTPKHPYTQALLSAIPVANPTLQRSRKRIVLIGEIPSAANPPSGCRFRTRCPFVMPICAQVDPAPTIAAEGVTVFCHLYDEKTSGNGASPPTNRTQAAPTS